MYVCLFYLFYSHESNVPKKKEKIIIKKKNKKIEDLEEVRRRKLGEQRIASKSIKSLKADELVLLSLIEARELMFK